MAQRSDAHQPEEQQSGLVPYGASSREYPLLPYEREICELAGFSEAEYKQFKQHLVDNAYIRPAEYALIPDIRNDPFTTTILVSLAIGLAFTGVSYLLAPKPPSLDDQQQVRERRLGSTRGRSTYAPLYGFDSLAEIATYGEPVPLVWTRYTGTTGGVVIAPKLIWSRVYSWGGFQTAKFLYTAGIFGIDRPELDGVWLGNSALNIANETQFAFYWRTQSTGSLTLHYGTDVGRNSGDPSGQRFPSFSQAYTPSNNTVFGVSNPVPNGTNYRVNWRVISLPDITEAGNGRKKIREERKKICGWSGGGMPGVGTGFPRRQGLINSNTFLLSAKWLSNFFEYKVTEDDINAELDGECAAADEVFQTGEKILIAGRLFEVTSRTADVFVPRSEAGKSAAQDVRVTLAQVEDVDPGFAPRTVSEAVITSDKPISRDDRQWNQGALYGIGNDPALKFTAASIRTTRPCDVVELGIKSNVWAQFNGICNFRTLPEPEELIEADSRNVNYTNGSMTQYFTRTAVFTIRYRFPDSEGIYPTAWTSSDVLFVVRGSTPVDQYNFIKLQTSTCTNVEYQFVPLTGASIVRRNDNSAVYWLYSKIYDPDAGQGNLLSVSLGGGITASFAGKIQRCIDCQLEPRMWQRTKDAEETSYKPVDGEFAGYRSADVPANTPIRPAWIEEIFGDVNNFPQGIVLGKALLFYNYKVNELKLHVLLRVRNTPTGWDQVSQEVYDPDSADISKYGITDENGNVLDYYDRPGCQTTIDPRWVTENAVSYNCIYPVFIGENNRYHARNYGLPELGTYQVIARFNPQNNPPVSANRQFRYFETNTQCMEVSHYGSLIRRSCDSQPEHQIVYVNEVRQGLSPTREGLTLAGLSIKSSRNFTAAEQLSLWIERGTQDSNSFPELVSYLLEKAAKDSNLDASMIDQASIDAAASYCNARGLFFDGVIGERQNLRSFIESTAQFFLLNMVIKNGKIGLQPAIPTGSPVAMFTAGNIVAGSLKVDYIPEGSRRPFQAVVSYRKNPKNQLPRTMTVRASWSDINNAPMEQIDMSSFCTSFDHAVKVARYFMAIRRYVTKTISFQTLPDQATIAPGDFIQVALEQTTASSGYVGTITGSGQIITPVNVPDGSYEAVYYKEGQSDVQETAITVSNGQVTTPEAWGSLFAIRSTTITTQQFVVDQVELDQDGLVNVQASEFPDTIGATTFNGDGIVLTPSSPDAC